MRFRSFALASFAASSSFALGSGFAPALIFVSRQESKLDPELLAGEGMKAIFVRFEDQLFEKGGDYEAFARANESRPRKELRETVLAGLKKRADVAYAKVAGEIEAMIGKGEIRRMARFWIVNGFAADATVEACSALARRPDVAYVYLQRSPGNLRQNLRDAEAPTLEGGYFEATKKVLDAKPAPPKSPGQGASLPWNVKRIGAERAWEEGARGQGVVVAINDGGVDPIPQLGGTFWRNGKETLNGKDDDRNGFIDDVFGYDFRRQSGHIFGGSGQFHGTMCSGIVAGHAAGGHSLHTGVAPEASLMVLTGMGFLRVFEYAFENGADIVSMSWMWPNIELGHYRGVFRLALEHLGAGGIVTVGGAGNFATSAPEGKQICLPKDIPACLSVAGIGADGKRPNFSSKGPVSWKGVKFYDDYPELQKPDFSAPNSGFPVWVRAEGLPARNWRTVWSGKEGEALIEGPQGNSFAGPHAAAVAALMLSVNKDLKPWQIERIMEETCEDLESPGWDKESGAGLISAHKAVMKAKALAEANTFFTFKGPISNYFAQRRSRSE